MFRLSRLVKSKHQLWLKLARYGSKYQRAVKSLAVKAAPWCSRWGGFVGRTARALNTVMGREFVSYRVGLAITRVPACVLAYWFAYVLPFSFCLLCGYVTLKTGAWVFSYCAPSVFPIAVDPKQLP